MLKPQSVIELNEFVQVLDACIALKRQQTPGLTARKVKKEGKPSECLPPADAPVWAVKNKGQFNVPTHADMGTIYIQTWNITFRFAYKTLGFMFVGSMMFVWSVKPFELIMFTFI